MLRDTILRRMLLIFVFVVLFIVPGFAVDSLPVETASEINPLYSDIPDRIDEQAPVMASADSGDVIYLSSEEELVDILRQGMVNRQETIIVYYQSENYLEVNDFSPYFHKAYEEGDDPLSGDYLHWSWQKMRVTRGGTSKNGIYYYTVTYSVVYYTTAAQEEEVTAQIDKILSEFDFASTATDYEKIKTIYDYICAHVTYDSAGYATINDGITGNDDYLCLTAYSALMEGEAVCQGYATLFYRMAEACGIDTRVIAGSSRSVNHAWNIVKLGQYYYNLDTTWDAGKETALYFLRSDETFAKDHTRWEDYTTEAFYAAYPMGNDYIPQSGVDHEHQYMAVVTLPTCTAQGYTTYTCECGSVYKSDYINMTDHSYAKTVTEPTCTAQGYTTYTCECGSEYKSDYTNITDHSYAKTVTAPTCTTKGYTTHICSCGDSYVDSYQDMLSHVWDSGKVTMEPTEQTEGVITFTCTSCAATREAAIAKLVNPFVDVRNTAQTSWYYRPVLWAVELEITNGVSQTQFAPNDTCTRAQVVTFLWRSAGSPEPESSAMDFVDVPQDAYYRKAVLWALERGITTGTDSTHFAPDDSCTRAQVVTFLWRLAGKPSASGSVSGFSDIQKNEYFYDSVLWAVEQEITNGLGNGTFGTYDTCTRGHVVTFLYRYYH